MTGGSARQDVLWAVVVGAIVLALYIVTLRPDVGGPEDSPKFQFVGYVLGTAHAPGYPLYTMLTHAFGKLPIGNLAYRINLFSALMGALACAGAFILSRQLGASPGSAAAATLALATGAAFWHNAIVAEVYTLAATLVVFVNAALISWGRTLERRRLYAACAWFAAGLGNHITIVGMLPAALVYGIVRDRRVLSVKVIAIAFAIGVAGMAQYGYIVLRTFQHAPHLEARATNLSEVVDVLMVRHQSDVRFQYSVRTIVTERIGLLVASLRDDMGTAGLALLTLGIAYGLWRRNGDVALVLGASIGMLAIIVNLYGDIPGFITPVVVLLWPLAALGLESIATAISPLTRRGPAIVTVVALVLPVANLIANEPEIDEYRRIDDVQAYRALFAKLPPHATVIVEDFWTWNVMKYLHFSGEYSPDPDPQLIPKDLDTVRGLVAAKTPVFAFRQSVDWMRAVGLRFKPAPLDGPPIESWLRQLPKGTLVAIAASGRPLPLEWLPQDEHRAIGRPRAFGTLAWTVGQSAIQLDQNDAASLAEVAQPAGRPALKLVANADGASIANGLEPLVLIDSGIAMVTIGPDGQVDRRLRVTPDARLTLPIDPAVFTFDRETPCVTLGAGRPVDVTGIVADGGWLTTMDRSGRAVIRMGFASPQRRSIQARLLQQGRAGVSVQSSSADGARVVFERASVSRPVFEVVIPEAESGVTATLEPGGVLEEMRVCGTSPDPLLRSPVSSGTIDVGPDGNGHFGAGWHDAERAGSQSFRWSERVSTFVFALDSPISLDLRWLLRAAHADGATVEARIGDYSVGNCTLPPGRWTDCRIRIPAALTTAGVNRLILTSTTAVDPDPRKTGDPRQLAFESEGGTVRSTR